MTICYGLLSLPSLSHPEARRHLAKYVEESGEVSGVERALWRLRGEVSEWSEVKRSEAREVPRRSRSRLQ